MQVLVEARERESGLLDVRVGDAATEAAGAGEQIDGEADGFRDELPADPPTVTAGAVDMHSRSKVTRSPRRCRPTRSRAIEALASVYRCFLARAGRGVPAVVDPVTGDVLRAAALRARRGVFTERAASPRRLRSCQTPFTFSVWCSTLATAWVIAVCQRVGFADRVQELLAARVQRQLDDVVDLVPS